MAPSTVASILDAIAKHWNLAQDVEISLEANPTSVEAASFRGFKAAGSIESRWGYRRSMTSN